MLLSSLLSALLALGGVPATAWAELAEEVGTEIVAEGSATAEGLESGSLEEPETDAPDAEALGSYSSAATDSGDGESAGESIPSDESTLGGRETSLGGEGIALEEVQQPDGVAATDTSAVTDELAPQTEPVVYDLNEYGAYAGRTLEEVVSRYDAALRAAPTYVNGSSSTYYVQNPSLAAPYAAGSLTDDTLLAMHEMTDYFRWLVGVEPLQEACVQSDELQAGALVRNYSFAHSVDDSKKPDDMPDALWRQGADVWHNIIAMGYTPRGSIIGWINEGYSAKGWDTLGHRYALIGASVSGVQFGYAGRVGIGLDTSNNNPSGDRFIAFPPPGEVPDELVSPAEAAWQVIFDTSCVTVADESNVRVTITNETTGETFVRSTSDDTLHVGTSGVTFAQPMDASWSYADAYTVLVEGLVDVATGAAAQLSYETSFFDASYELPSSVASTKAEFSSLTIYQSLSDETSLRKIAAVLPGEVTVTTTTGATYTLPVEGPWALDTSRTCYCNKVSPDGLPANVDDNEGVLSDVTIPYTVTDDQYESYNYLSFKTPVTRGDSGTVKIYRTNVSCSTTRVFRIVDNGDGTYAGRLWLDSDKSSEFDAAASAESNPWHIYQIDSFARSDAGEYVSIYLNTKWGNSAHVSNQIRTLEVNLPSIASAQASGLSDQIYTGQAFTPTPTLTLNGTVLRKDVDYTLSYDKNTNVGTATVKAKGIGDYSGELSAAFAIAAADISQATIAGVGGQAYTGSAIKPVATVTWKGTKLNSETDYTVSYGTNTNVGTGTLTVTGKGNFKGTLSASFAITPADISTATIDAIPALVYTGQAHTPAPVVKLGGKTLVAGADYSVAYTANTNVGTATVTVTGKGNYAGTVGATFAITALSLAQARVASIADQTYTGKALVPEPAVTLDSKTLAKGTDYTLSYDKNTNVGTATVTATGKGNYADSVSQTFRIVPADIVGAGIAGIRDQVYTGERFMPVPQVSWNGKALSEGADYTLSYGDNTNVGNGSVTVTGKGNFANASSVLFAISPASIATAAFSPLADQTYTGDAFTPEPTVKLGSKTLVKDVDYTLSYRDNTAAGTATVTATGRGNYAGTASATFGIAKANIAAATVATVPNQTYTGAARTPKPILSYNGRTLREGTDYTLSYERNTEVGEATVTIAGAGNFSGTTSAPFRIVAGSLADATVSAIADQAYTGSAVTPSVTVTLGGRTLAAGTDYTVAYADNVDAGTATAVVGGAGNYGGEIARSFKILPADLAQARVAAIADQAYTGEPLRPAPSVTWNGAALVAGRDYTLAYGSSTNVGTATVTLTGTGNFAGSTQASFAIVAADLSGATLSGLAPQTYTGKALAPAPTVTLGGKALVAGADYTVAYANNTAAGTATATVTGKGNYCGSASATFEIAKAHIANATVAAIPSQTWTGKPLTPEPTLTLGGNTLKKGTDYTLTYRDNIEVGTATVTITGAGSVEGARDESFTIVWPNPFVDVTVGVTAHDQDILWLAARGITTGWKVAGDKREFRGMSPVVRQDMAAFLYRLAGSPDYTPSAADKAMFLDVDENTPHAKEIWWLASAGISTGWKVAGGREFRGMNAVVRQDMAAFLQRLASRQMGLDTALPAGYANPFSDVTEGTAHREDILWLAASGVSAGWKVAGGREFRGMSPVVRQDMAAFLHRLDGLR